MRRMLAPLTLAACLALPATVAAERPHDRRALQDIEQGRILWDVTLADPKALLARLQVIEQTYRDLRRQGVEPRMLFTFHGGAVELLARTPDRFAADEVTEVGAVQDKLAALKAREGVSRIEVCSIAADRADLGQGDLIKPVVMVGNTFVTAAAYAQRGYAKIRLH
ncbi:DsrE family protein [Thiohalorhabdus sp.]|uniref:DsrE family protein n=1 Tax=Thiohalorhabdus sp. TaxID=3094134 RepID=UPI002FC3AD14